MIELNGKIVKNNVHFYNIIGSKNLNETYTSFHNQNSAAYKSYEYRIKENKVKHDHDSRENSHEMLVNSDNKDSINSESFDRGRYNSNYMLIKNTSRNYQIKKQYTDILHIDSAFQRNNLKRVQNNSFSIASQGIKMNQTFDIKSNKISPISINDGK